MVYPFEVAQLIFRTMMDVAEYSPCSLCAKLQPQREDVWPGDGVEAAQGSAFEGGGYLHLWRGFSGSSFPGESCSWELFAHERLDEALRQTSQPGSCQSCRNGSTGSIVISPPFSHFCSVLYRRVEAMTFGDASGEETWWTKAKS